MEQHIIPITNGNGSKEIVNGTYNIEATAVGYDVPSIDPKSLEISDDADSYSLTIAATGTLTLHVTDDGTELGVPIENAVFYRCDDAGTTYGDAITSNIDGDAIFNYVPFADDGAPVVYYKQTASDGEHTFDDALQNITLTEETTTVQIANSDAPLRTFTLTDKNYTDLPIADASITLSK